LNTTPGQLRVASVVLTGALVVTLVVTVAATNTRGRAAATVGRSTVPELLAAKDLYGSLAGADATESVIFLQAGLEKRALRQKYEDDIAAAGRQLATLGRAVGSSPDERAAIATIARKLPEYTGDVESARVNIRQGFPLGAAYLREASSVMRDDILPAATALYNDAGDRLEQNYRDGTSAAHIVLVVGFGIATVVLLIAVQLFVARRSRRMINIPMLGATVIVCAVVGFTVLRFVSAQNSLVHAQRHGSDAVQLLSASGILALQAQADDNIALTERATADSFRHDYHIVMLRLGGEHGESGLLGQTSGVAQRGGSIEHAAGYPTAYVRLLALHRTVQNLDTDGSYHRAVDVATHEQADAFDRFEAAIGRDISRAENALYDDAGAAHSGFKALGIAVPLLLVLAGALVLRGLQRRIAEYS
jgi:hypothetical protein